MSRSGSPIIIIIIILTRVRELYVFEWLMTAAVAVAVCPYGHA